MVASLPTHPNVCQYLRTLTVNGSPAIVMPYAPGGSIGDRMTSLHRNPDDRPYWERHYGITRGKPNREGWKRLGRAWFLAVAAVCLLVAIGTAIADWL